MKTIIHACVLAIPLVISAQRDVNTNSPHTDSQFAFTTNAIPCLLSCTIKERAVWIDLTFTNSTDVAIGVWERNLLLEPKLTWAPFEISRDGHPVPYMGLYVKRLPPSPSEFYVLRPYAVLKQRIELSSYYDVKAPGEYSIKYFAINASYKSQNQFAMQSAMSKFEVTAGRR
jgi:hypothetical protein